MSSNIDDWVTVKPGETVPGTTAPPVSVGEVPSDWVTVGTVGASEKQPPQSTGQKIASGWTDALNYGGFGIPNRVVAAKRALMGEEPDYSTALENLNKQQQQFTRENPAAAIGARTAGGLLGGVGAGAITRAAVPSLSAGTSLGARTAAGAVEGGAYGALGGAGHTYSGIPSDYVHNAGMGAILGAGIGGAAPAVGAGVKGAYNWASEKVSGIPSSIARSAAIDEAGLRNLPRGGMMPDAGPAMLGEAQGVAQGNTPGKGRMIGALKERDAETNQVIANQMQTFGRPVTPSRVDTEIGERMQALGAAYDEVLNNARAINSEPLALWLDGAIGNARGPVQTALRQARGWLEIPSNPGVLDPHPRAAQSARTAVRGIRDDPNQPPAVRTAMDIVERRMTQELQAKVPGIRELDSQYAELGAQQRAIRTGSEGQGIFKTGENVVQRPDELRVTMQGEPHDQSAIQRAANRYAVWRASGGHSPSNPLTPVWRHLDPNELPPRTKGASEPKGVNVGPSAEGFRLQQAARAEMERIVGTNKNDLNKLENVLGTPQDWNQQKLATMFGEDRARGLMEVLQNLRGQRETFQKVWENSQTAARLAAMERQKAASGEMPASPTFYGDFVRKPIQKGINAIRDYNAEKASDRIAGMLAERNPARIQELVDQLLRVNTARDQRGRIARSMVERSMISSVPAVADVLNR